MMMLRSELPFTLHRLVLACAFDLDIDIAMRFDGCPVQLRRGSHLIDTGFDYGM